MFVEKKIQSIDQLKMNYLLKLYELQNQFMNLVNKRKEYEQSL